MLRGYYTVLLFLFLSFSMDTVFGDPPALINHQGRLTDATNLVTKQTGISLRLYDVFSGGTHLYEDSNTVSVVDGLYSTFIGDNTVTGSLRDVLAVSTQIYLEVVIDGVALSPRERMAGIGYALIPGVRGLGNAETGLWSNVAGGEGNHAGGDWSTVSGGSTNFALGKWSTVSGGSTNRASGKYSTISGGERNVAKGISATIVGGRFNTANGETAIAGGEGSHAGAYAIALGLDNRAMSYASGIYSGDDNTITNTEYAVIVGGQHNKIISATEYGGILSGYQNVVGPSGMFAVVVGGFSNRAAGQATFAAGNQAQAIHEGSFVWGDNISVPVSSTTSNQATFRATGGFRILSGASTNTGVEVLPGSGSWTSLSDVNAKKNLVPVHGPTVLEALLGMPVYTWSYKTQDDSVRHIGPTAQDFNTAFRVGDKPNGITVVDADGVALAAIQELARRNAALEAKVEELQKQLQYIAAPKPVTP